MKYLLFLIFAVLSFGSLSASVITRNGIVSGLHASPKSIQLRQFEAQYPWLVSRDELNKELLRIAKCFSENSNDKDVWVEFKPLLKSFMLSHELSEGFGYHIRTCAVSEFW